MVQLPLASREFLSDLIKGYPQKPIPAGNPSPAPEWVFHSGPAFTASAHIVIKISLNQDHGRSLIP